VRAMSKYPKRIFLVLSRFIVTVHTVDSLLSANEDGNKFQILLKIQLTSS
jgi:hypothetical protein